MFTIGALPLKEFKMKKHLIGMAIGFCMLFVLISSAVFLIGPLVYLFEKYGQIGAIIYVAVFIIPLFSWFLGASVMEKEKDASN